MTKQLYGIIGHPVSHSLSPAMQNAAFEAVGMEAEYKPFDVEPADLEDYLRGLARKGMAGLNVTIPHKIKAKEWLEANGRLDENAKRLGAVNTIKVTGKDLSGYNTDGAGFYRSLVEDLGFEPEGRTIFLLGAGGAARAIAMYLGNGPGEILVYDVDNEKTKSLKIHYDSYYDKRRLKIVKEEGLKEALEGVGLLVNATPVGMKEGDPSPIDTSLLKTGTRVYDLVYNRETTVLTKEANGLKLHAITGLGMLLYQGAIAFEIWTGKKAPVAVMRKALKEALKKGQGSGGKGQG